MIRTLEILFWIILFLIIYTYIFYPIVLLMIVRFHSTKRNKDVRHRPTVSVIIAAFNEKKVIQTKLRNCLSMDYPKNKIEFIFGSDYSTDGTDQDIKDRSKKHKNIRLYSFKKREGKANVINKIVPRANGEILIFSDANTMYEANSIKKIVSHFADSKIGGVCGKLILINPNQNGGGTGESVYWDYENKIKKLEGDIKTVFGASGGIYAIRKKLFRMLPRHTTNISDDFLIPMKVVEQGFDIVYEEKAIAREYASINMKDEYLRKVRIGAANIFAVQKITHLLHPKRGFVAFGLWSHKIIRWIVPFLMILLSLVNLFLLKIHFYFIFLILQILFYGFAFGGWLCDKIQVNIKPFYIFYYLVSINLALLVGYYKYYNGTIKPTWARLER